MGYVMKSGAAIILLLLTQAIWASDLPFDSAHGEGKERRWAEQIEQTLMVGDALWLKAGPVTFLGLHTPAQGTAQGTVILLHGKGVHPDWPQVIAPLRGALPEQGWATLAIQLPVLGNEASLDDYAPLYGDTNARIAAAIAHLRKESLRPIVLLGHSQGAAMAAHYLDVTTHHGIAGLIAIGMPRTGPKGSDQKLPQGIPVFEIIGAEDFPEIMASAAQRMDRARQSGDTTYRVEKIAGADHFFEGQEDALTETIVAWLKAITTRAAH